MNIDRRTILSGIGASACCIPFIPRAHAFTEEPEPFRFICGIGGNPIGKSIENVRPARPQAERAIQWISELIGIRPAFELREADFKRKSIAMAATRGVHRYVIYDAKWFTFEENTIPWYAIWVFAHEIGHHIHGHTHGYRPDRHRGELDADRFGGWVVSRLGGRLDQALAFMPILSERGGKSHPPRTERIEATKAGWQAGQAGNLYPRLR